MHALILTVQWFATAVSILGSFWLGNRDRRHRHWGFAILLASNVLWGWWSVDTQAWGLLTTQIVYVVLNVRGLLLSDPIGPPGWQDAGHAAPDRAMAFPAERPPAVAVAAPALTLGSHAQTSQR
jgi:drug/metabolite transporter (DMT)-like permease